MSSLHVLSKRGDDSICWDNAKVALGEDDALAAIQEAERIFEEERARGAIAFNVDDPARPIRLYAFLPSVHRIIIVPQLIGG